MIPKNMEKYVSFQLGNLRFLDSLQFLGPGASLDVLAGNLTEFPHLKEHFDKVWSFSTAEDMQLLCQKGVYPYSRMDSFSKFEETSLPPKEGFKNDLTEEDISEEKYEFAQRVWKTIMIYTSVKTSFSWQIFLISFAMYVSHCPWSSLGRRSQIYKGKA